MNLAKYLRSECSAWMDREQTQVITPTLALNCSSLLSYAVFAAEPKNLRNLPESTVPDQKLCLVFTSCLFYPHKPALILWYKYFTQ